MESYMGVATGQPCQRRNGNPGECRKRFASKARKSQIEPDHVWTFASNCLQHTPGIFQAVECPASIYGESVKFRARIRVFIRQNLERDTWSLLQLAGDVVSVFVQGIPARRKGRYQ